MLHILKLFYHKLLFYFREIWATDFLLLFLFVFCFGFFFFASSLVTLLCFKNKQPYFPTTIFTLLNHALNTSCKKVKMGCYYTVNWEFLLCGFHYPFNFTFLANQEKYFDVYYVLFDMVKGQLLRLWAFSEGIWWHIC